MSTKMELSLWKLYFKDSLKVKITDEETQKLIDSWSK